MRFGIHLPQFGRAAVPGGIQRAAVHAEALGYGDVWVSDHLVHPVAQAYPAPLLYDPLVSLAFAAAVTQRVGLGTSVLVGPQYTSPLALANTLASLDSLSSGRLTIGIGIGWSEAEYRALHASFDHRGARLDEIIDLFRAVFRDDPTSHEGTYYSFADVQILPKPAGATPIWVGGGSEGAFERAVTRGDGFHGIGVAPEAAAAVVERLRARRPEPEFTISLRVDWDARSTSADDIKIQREVYENAGVQHLVIAPSRGDIDAWLAGMETIGSALELSAGEG